MARVAEGSYLRPASKRSFPPIRNRPTSSDLVTLRSNMPCPRQAHGRGMQRAAQTTRSIDPPLSCPGSAFVESKGGCGRRLDHLDTPTGFYRSRLTIGRGALLWWEQAGAAARWSCDCAAPGMGALWERAGWGGGPAAARTLSRGRERGSSSGHDDRLKTRIETAPQLLLWRVHQGGVPAGGGRRSGKTNGLLQPEPKHPGYSRCRA